MKKLSRTLFPTRCFLDASADLDFGVEDIDTDEELDIVEFVLQDSVLSILVAQFK
jgi:hypothetical protein